MKFNQSLYHVIEDSGPVQPTLLLSDPLSFDITVEVFNTNITASGEDYSTTKTVLLMYTLCARWRY